MTHFRDTASTSTAPSTSSAGRLIGFHANEHQNEGGRKDSPFTLSLSGEYPLDDIIGSMMFVHGDSDDPTLECRSFVLQLVRQQLRNMVTKAMEVANIRGRHSIGYSELLFLFRRHPIMVKRLIDYTRLLETVPAFYSQSLQPGSNTGDYGGENLPVAEHDSEKLRRTTVVMAALKEMDVSGEISELMDPLNPARDERREERLLRMSARTKVMPVTTYNKFAEARSVSFCSKRGKKSSMYVRAFLHWLGSPSVEEEGIAYVLNYCATEIVAIITSCALLCKEQEWTKAASDEKSTSSLQLRHYKEALGRSRGYAKRGDLLFGNF